MTTANSEQTHKRNNKFSAKMKGGGGLYSTTKMIKGNLVAERQRERESFN